MNKLNAPIELLQMGLDPSKFHYSDSKSWRGPCSQCGGSRRFVVFTNNEWPLWNGFCDLCGTTIKAWQKVKAQYDPHKAAAVQAEQERMEAERIALVTAKVAEFTTHELWTVLHNRMTQEHIDWWEAQGIPQSIQNDLRIGFTSDKPYYDSDKNLLHSPAYTIPWFGYNYKFNTMQYRLINDKDRRYIFENGLGGGRHYYMTKPTETIQDKVIICEGAKKAIVTQFWLVPDDSYTVLAASSNNTFGAALEATKNCGLRYIIMDPGSAVWEKKAVETNKKSTHVIRLPAKIDDMWKDYNLDRRQFTSIMQNAI
jgi:hypothetical protein